MLEKIILYLLQRQHAIEYSMLQSICERYSSAVAVEEENKNAKYTAQEL